MGNRYTVQHRIDLQQQDDATNVVYDEQIDLALLLSQRLQRNVRQGHVFKIHKVQFGLTPKTGGDLDTGLSTAGTLRWTPATKNSVKAWNIAFKTWLRQKQLRLGAVGQGVRYDDFEVAYHNDYKTSRTSTLFTTGMEDSNAESVVIYGASSSGADVSLQDMYESLAPQALPSRFPLDNSVVKESKFTNTFPAHNQITFGASWSTIVSEEIADPDSGAMYTADPVYIEDKNSLCGILVAKGYVLAEDVPLAIEDELVLTINITCEISTPLVSRKPKSKRYKRKGGAKRGRSSRARRSKR